VEERGEYKVVETINMNSNISSINEQQEEGQQANLLKDVLIFILIIITRSILLKSVQGSSVEVADFHQVDISSLIN
jgi:hypothetical protein